MSEPLETKLTKRTLDFDFRGAKGSTYDNSSQRKHWMFTPEELLQHREKINKRVHDRVDTVRKLPVPTPTASILELPLPPTSTASSRLSVSPSVVTITALTPDAKATITPEAKCSVTKAISFGCSPVNQRLVHETPAQPTSSTQTGMTPFFAAASLGEITKICFSVTPAPVRSTSGDLFLVPSASSAHQSSLSFTSATPFPPKAKLDPLSVDETHTLLLHHKILISQLTSKLNLSHIVTATAITFFTRFFLFNSMMDYCPTLVTLTCISLACKAEEHVVDLHHLAKLSDIKDPAIIVEWEVPILEGIKFHLRVYHPYRPLNGLVKAMRNTLPNLVVGDWCEIKFSRLCAAAHTFIEKSYFTDASFHYSPALIALSALSQACKDSKVDWFERFFSIACKPLNQADSEGLKHIYTTLTTIQAAFAQGLEAKSDTAQCQSLLTKLRTGSRQSVELNKQKRHREKETNRQKKLLKKRKETELRMANLMGPTPGRELSKASKSIYDDEEEEDAGEFVIISKTGKRCKHSSPAAPLFPPLQFSCM